jgi:ribonuclease VapC
MVIDTSALVAILGMEPEVARLAMALEADTTRLVCAAAMVETAMVIESRRGIEGGKELDLLIARTGMQIEPVTLAQAEVAREAWRRFGKGRHPAGLNFGDCFSYALARVTGEPLLFKGEDFALTDVTVVSY